MNTYNIYKKRDGQSFKLWSEIYASSFDEAKKIFAHNMTKDNWEKSNDICWLTIEEDGVPTGFYDLGQSIVVANEETGEADYTHEDTELVVFCLEEDIKNGFDYWNEDVYTWELRDNEDEEEEDNVVS